MWVATKDWVTRALDCASFVNATLVNGLVNGSKAQ
jgi:hypothetical protein